MPPRLRGNQAALERMAALSRPMTKLNVLGLYEEIRHVVDGVIRSTAKNAQQTAVAKAPVRHIFKGGRKTYGVIGRSALLREYAAYTAAFGTMSREQYVAQRAGQRVVTHANRSQNWANTAQMRRLDVGGGVSRWNQQQLSEGARRSLTARGWWEYMHVNRRSSAYAQGVIGAEGNWSMGEPTPNVKTASLHPTLGGALVKSIRLEEDTIGDWFPKWSVVAGGGKVDYAKYQEFGTRHNAAHPFLRPALKSVEYSYVNRMTYALSRLARSRPTGGG